MWRILLSYEITPTLLQDTGTARYTVEMNWCVLLCNTSNNLNETGSYLDSMLQQPASYLVFSWELTRIGCYSKAALAMADERNYDYVLDFNCSDHRSYSDEMESKGKGDVDLISQILNSTGVC